MIDRFRFLLALMLGLAALIAWLHTIPATMAANTDRPIFTDQLAAGWSTWGWGYTEAVGPTGEVHTGSAALAVTFHQGWARIHVQHEAPIDLNNYSALRLWVHGGSERSTSLLLTLLGADGDAMDAYSITITPAPGHWREITLPFLGMGSPAAMRGFALQNSSEGGRPVFYVDSISLVEDHRVQIPPPAAPPMPANRFAPLGTNLGEAGSTEVFFTDLFHTFGGWLPQCDIGVEGCEAGPHWNTGEADLLELDTHGWVRSLPAPKDPPLYWMVGTMLYGHPPIESGPEQGLCAPPLGGEYVVIYDGEGTLQFGANVTVQASSPGRMAIYWDRSSGDCSLYVRLTATDPNGTGDYLRNLRIVPAAYEATYSTHLFYPPFLERIQPYRLLRFMDVMRTNFSAQGTWSDRPLPTDAGYGDYGAGMPIEIMVALANEIDADPWFTLPHQATDEYIEAFARLVLEQLDPERRVYVEYSNEVWNAFFSQSDWVAQQGLAEWPGADYTLARSSWYGKRTAQICDIWRSVWAGVPSGQDRVQCVMASQTGAAHLHTQILDCPLWVEGAPCVEHGISALATAPYFGGNAGSPQNIPTLLAWASAADGVDRLLDDLETGGPVTAGSGLDSLSTAMLNDIATARSYGLTPITYEGGQHLVSVWETVDYDEISTLFQNTNRHPRMGDFYRDYLNRWRDLGGELFVHFTNAGLHSKWGSFGALEYITQQDNVPKHAALMDFIAANGCWWPDCAGEEGVPPATGTPTPTPTPTNTATYTATPDDHSLYLPSVHQGSGGPPAITTPTATSTATHTATATPSTTPSATATSTATATPSATPTTPAPDVLTYSGGTCPAFTAGENSFASGSDSRHFRLSLPANPNGAPVLFVWHWLGGNPTDAVNWLGLSSLPNVILAVPTARGDAVYDWHFTAASPTANPDLLLFDDILACLHHQYSVDLDRIWATGHSAGAIWTSYLAMHRAHRLAAVAALSGGLPEPNVAPEGYVTPASPIPVLLAYLNARSVAEGLPACYSLPPNCTGSAAGGDLACTGAVTVDAAGGNPYACTGYRLPTEAEWEYAYRAGTSTELYNGDLAGVNAGCGAGDSLDTRLDAIAWYCLNSNGSPQPVGGKMPNAWGLYDMAGNVWELVWDRYDGYPSGAVTDPLGPGSGEQHIVRGGGWSYAAERQRAAVRVAWEPAGRSWAIGLRPVRTVPE